MDTSFDARYYYDNKSLNYTTTGSSLSQSEINIANSEISLAFAGWDTLLYKKQELNCMI